MTGIRRSDLAKLRDRHFSLSKRLMLWLTFIPVAAVPITFAGVAPAKSYAPALLAAAGLICVVGLVGIMGASAKHFWRQAHPMNPDSFWDWGRPRFEREKRRASRASSAVVARERMRAWEAEVRFHRDPEKALRADHAQLSGQQSGPRFDAVVLNEYRQQFAYDMRDVWDERLGQLDPTHETNRPIQ